MGPGAAEAPPTAMKFLWKRVVPAINWPRRFFPSSVMLERHPLVNGQCRNSNPRSFISDSGDDKNEFAIAGLPEASKASS